MQLSLLLVSLLARAAFAAPNAKRDLRSCVEKVLGATAAQRIVAPGDEQYTDARLGETIQFTQLPTLITFAEKSSEVGQLVQCAKKSGIKAVPRTGGHHFVGYSALSDTLVIDISHIDDVVIATDKKTAVVGGGLRFGALLTVLGEQNLTWTSGICPTVGISGFLGAGGFNMQMRQLGLAVDNVVAAKVVKADGQIVTASPSQNADLWFAIRGGGGGTYGIVVEWTLKLFSFPRSAMVLLQYNEPGTRADVAKAFHAWAPKADNAFSSQINIFKNRTEVLGWCLGCSKEKLQGLIDESGLVQIGKPVVWLSGGCNTNNARMFGYIVNECLPDEVVAQYAPFALNTIQQPFIKVANNSQYTYDQQTKAPGQPQAQPWTRFRRLSKSFFEQKQKKLSFPTIQNLISRLDVLPDEAAGWIEWHAWNLASTGTAAFAWREQAYSHIEVIVTSSLDETVHQGYVSWFADLEKYLRPKIGAASYAGYMDDKISSPPLESYYGANVKRLSQIKRKYDPDSFFTNPLSIPPRL